MIYLIMDFLNFRILFENISFMKRCLLSLIVSMPLIAACQQPDLHQYDGLLYAPKDMQELKKTADSLNVRYLQCVPNPQYHSWPQSEGLRYNLIVKDKQLALVQKRLKSDISLAVLLKEFPGIEVTDITNAVVAYYSAYDVEKKKMQTTVLHGNANNFEHDVLDAPPTGKWVCMPGNYSYDDTTKYYLTAILLNNPFKTYLLPQEYAKMIQYVDCMVDTSTTVMVAAKYGEEDSNRAFISLKEYIHTQKHTSDTDWYYTQPEDWQYVHNEYAVNKQVRKWVDDAVKNALDSGNGGGELEAIASGIYSRDTLLLLKRSRIVVGECSQDRAPIEHAYDIAVLASQLHQWPVFIKSHLNIMNDRFDRNSDGSYAQAGRKTYLRELEVLDVPAQQLLLGSIFRATEISDKHYYGNLGRIGRAFTESAKAAEFEKQVKTMIKDKNLDPFNQCLFSMVYYSYCNWQPDVNKRETKLADFKKEAAAYPAYISAVLQSGE